MFKVQYFDIILFAFVAAFVIVRLGKALGRRPGDNKPRTKDFLPRSTDSTENNVVSISGSSSTPENSSMSNEKDDSKSSGLVEIRQQSPDFEVRAFLSGARAAYEMVVIAFAAGDQETLKRLLTSEVLDNFSNAIREREKRGESLETTVVGIDKVEIIEAKMTGRFSEITVKFVSQLINVARDAEGVEVGEETDVKQVVDMWTFVRDVRSSDPNWSLAETRSTA